MGHVSSRASVKTVFPAPVKWWLWAVKGPLLFMICKKPLQQLRPYRAAASSCRLLAVQRCVAACEEHQNRLLLFSTHDTLCPTSLFRASLLQTSDEKSMCGCWAPCLRLTSPTPSSPSALPPPLPRPLTVHSSGEAHWAPCPQRWRPPRPSPPMPHLRPQTPAALLPPPPHPRCRSRKRRRRVSDGTRPPNPNTTATKTWPLVFSGVHFPNVPVLFCISPREDRWVPAGQVSRGWREVQGQADRHRWRLGCQRRQDVPGLHDETKSKGQNKLLMGFT